MRAEPEFTFAGKLAFRVKPSDDDFAFDEPRFAVLWAGDEDEDGAIEIKMEMGPNYSCSKKNLRFFHRKRKRDNL